MPRLPPWLRQFAVLTFCLFGIGFVEPFSWQPGGLGLGKSLHQLQPDRHATARCARRFVGRPLELRASYEEERDLNRLHTALSKAIESEEYGTAAGIRDQIATVTGQEAKTGGGWQKLGVPDWLADRAERMGFLTPTQVQKNSLQTILDNKDTVIRSPTGSGKTLAYLVPMLAHLSNELLDESISKYLSKYMAKGKEPSPRGASRIRDEEAPTPLAVIVVPSKELGVQVSLLVYQLLGGHRNNPSLLPVRIDNNHMPGSKTNMFTYKGPRNVKVVSVLDDEALNASMPIGDLGLDILKGAHIIVGTPEYLGAVADRGHVPLNNSRFVVVDEADECMREEQRLDSLFQACGGKVCSDGKSRVVAFVGASLDTEQVRHAAEKQWLTSPAMVLEKIGAEPDWDSPQCVPPSLKHKYVVCNDETRSLVVLSRLMKQEMSRLGADIDTPPRFIVYGRDARTAHSIAKPLQNALWAGLGGSINKGLWGLSVLLPQKELEEVTGLSAMDNTTKLTYQSSVRVIEMFLFNQTNVLVTTPLATRGLDFPDVSTVFNLGIVGSAADYLHRSGRVGRIGHTSKGSVVSIVDEEGALQLQALGKELQFVAEEVRAPEAEVIKDDTSTDDKVRFLEDIFHLLMDDKGQDEDGKGGKK